MATKDGEIQKEHRKGKKEKRKQGKRIKDERNIYREKGTEGGEKTH